MADGIDWSMLSDAIATPADPVQSLYYGAATRQNAQKLADAERLQAAQSAAQQKAAQLYQAGDTRGAQAALIGSGQWDGVTGVNASDKQMYDQARTNTADLAGIAVAVQHLPYDQRASAIQTLKTFLVGQGLHSADIDAFDPTDNNLAAIHGYGYSPEKQDANAVAVQNAAINAQNAQTQAQRLAYDITKPVEMDPTKNYIMPDGATVAGAPAISTGSASGGSAADNSRAARNNNPGNLRWDGHSKWQGMTGVDPQGFVQFDTPENGQRALGINIANQQKLHGINTVGDFIAKYAPPSDHNDTGTYAQTVARALGVGVNDRVNFSDPHVQHVLSAAITGVEAGSTPAKFADNAAPNESASQTASAGWHMVQTGVAKADPNSVDPSDPAIEMAARQYAITGDMPALGMGNGGMRKAILTRAAQIVQENHWSPAQIVANRADYKSSTSALTNDQKQYDTIQGAENTAINNGQRFIDLSANAPGNTASSWYNESRNYLGQKFGDSRVSDMNAAYQTFITEWFGPAYGLGAA